MLYSLANKQQYEAVMQDVLGTIRNNLTKKFNSAIAVETIPCDDGSVRLRFTIPEESFLRIENVNLNATLAEGLIKEQE